jgi:serine/threonine protein kinase
MSQGRKPEDEEGLTSDEIFGDLVDAPAPEKPAQPPATAGQRPAAIKVKIAERRSADAGQSDPLPEELAALIDAFDDHHDEAEILEPPPEPSSHPPTPTEPGTPTPLVLEPLPDLPEVEEAERLRSEAEARSDFVKLTRQLRKALPKPLAPPGVDLAGVAETALAAAAASDRGGPDAVLPDLPGEAEEGNGYGPYQLLEKIAVGGMAEVFKAKRRGLAGFEKVIAVKRILPHLSHNEEFVTMFVDEAKLVAGLTHPNIVHIFDLGRIGASYYIAMEYVDGRDLRSTLKRLHERAERLPAGLAVFVASRVASALDHAHRHKDAEGRPLRIVHRDVSPQNILISFEGQVKLTDFGIAKAATKASTTERGALRGKLMYMSPEQAWGRPIDHRSDLFSLGIVLYEMLSGERPFLGAGSSDMGILKKVREADVPPLAPLGVTMPAELERIVMRALAREPDDRPRTAGILQQDLESLLNVEPPATARELGRFMRQLFGVPDEDTQEHHVEAELAAASEPPDKVPSLLEPLSVEQLLRRFGDD